MSVKRFIISFKKNLWFIMTVLALSVLIAVNGFDIYRGCVYRSIEQEVIKEWKIQLPNERSIQYAAQAVYPDGHDTYMVYKVKELPPYFHGNQAFTKSMMKEIITAVQNGGWLAPPNHIPKKYLPDWSEGCDSVYFTPVLEFGSFRNGYCMAYFSESKLLLVCEKVSR